MERQKLRLQAEAISERKNEEMKNKEEKSTLTESEATKDREALREDYETLFITAKNTH